VHLNRVKTDKRQDTKTDVFQERYFKLKTNYYEKITCILIVFSLITVVSFGQGYQTPVEGDYVIEDFQFESGKLSKLNLHYRTIGKPTKGLGKLITQY
jgi:hypothetical protein